MARMIRRRSRSRVSRPRRYVWTGFQVGATVAAATVNSANTPLGDLETDLGGDLVGWRLERVLLNGFVSLNATANAAADVGPYFIYLYVHEEALTATMVGRGADPRSFIYYRAAELSTTAAIPAAGTSEMATDRFSADIRARRVFRRVDEVFRLGMENSEAATFSLRFSVNMRILLSKPA